MSLLEDHRRQAAVDHCVSEVRQLQSQGDLRAAATLVEQGLQTFPSEARLVQLQASLKKGLEEVRRRELEESKRLRQDAATTVDEPTLQTYSGHLDDITPDIRPRRRVFGAVRSDPRFRWRNRRASAAAREPGPRLRQLAGTRTCPCAPPPGWQHAAFVGQGSPKTVGGRRTRRPRGALAHRRRLSRLDTRSRHRSLPLPPQQGTLEITTSPPGAAVLVNGKPSGTATGAAAAPGGFRIR